MMDGTRIPLVVICKCGRYHRTNLDNKLKRFRCGMRILPKGMDHAADFKYKGRWANITFMGVPPGEPLMYVSVI